MYKHYLWAIRAKRSPTMVYTTHPWRPLVTKVVLKIELQLAILTSVVKDILTSVVEYILTSGTR